MNRKIFKLVDLLQYNTYLENIEKCNTIEHKKWNEKFSNSILSEGLIYSVNFNKLKSIISKIFNINVEINSDDDIFIDDINKIDTNKLNILINNLGYFISRGLKKDDNEYENFNKNDLNEYVSITV